MLNVAVVLCLLFDGLQENNIKILQSIFCNSALSNMFMLLDSSNWFLWDSQAGDATICCCRRGIHYALLLCSDFMNNRSCTQLAPKMHNFLGLSCSYIWDAWFCHPYSWYDGSIPDDFCNWSLPDGRILNLRLLSSK